MIVLWVLLILPSFIIASESQVLKQTKEDILNAEDFASAYQKYTAAFGSTPYPTLKAGKNAEENEKDEKMRKNLFMKSLTSARTHNKRYRQGESTYKMTVNRFFTMNQEEKKRHLGLNGQQFSRLNQRYKSSPSFTLKGEKENLPESFHWNHEGYLVNIKDQGSCGSCWAFSTVGLMEWASAKVTGQNTTLSEQYVLDCTYEGENSRDGCNGGWYTEAWDYIIQGQQTGGVTHLVKQSDYAYEAKDNRCVNGAHTNALKNILRLTGYVHVVADEDSVLRAVAFKMPLAVAMTVENDFYQLGEGIYDGCKEKTYPNHAVILSGYGKNYFEIRNSWGTDWGVGGYGKLKRNGDMCNILSYAYYIEYDNLSSDDKDDSGNDNDQSNKDGEEEKEENKKDDEKEKQDENEKEKKENVETITPGPDFLTSASTVGASSSSTFKLCMDNPQAQCSWRKCSMKKNRHYIEANCPLTCNLC